MSAYEPEGFDGDLKQAGRRMKAIREKVGLEIEELAELLRISDTSGMRQMERGKRRISGPVRLVLEMLEDGRLDPADELDEIVDELEDDEQQR